MPFPVPPSFLFRPCLYASLGIGILTTPQLPAGQAQILLDRLDFEPVTPQQVKVTMAASSQGVEVGSYFIRLDQQPGEGELDGFIPHSSGYQFLESLVEGKQSPLLLDNGPRDEEIQEGIFSVTLDTSKWPDGRYEFRVGAHNRPAKGDYVTGHRTLQILIVDGKAEPSLIEKPFIKIRNFSVEKLDKNRTKLSISAEGYGMNIGSFAIRVDSRPKSPSGGPLPGFFENQYFEYLMQPHGGKPSAFLMDNGPLDEDQRKGVFAYTLNMAGWPRGAYSIVASANNRPAPGAYIGAQSDYVTLTVGEDKEEVEISNIRGAEHGIVYQKEGIYACFPSLAVLPDGRLMVSMGTRTKRSHVDNAGGMAFAVSSDRGKTWTPSHERMVRKEWRTSDGRYVTVDTEGWVFADATKLPELRAQNRILEPNGEVRPGVVAYLGGAKSRVSSDEGKTWESQPILLSAECLGLIGYNKAANELVTKKGARLYIPYGKRYQTDRAGKQGLDEPFIIRSEDEGRTWECKAMFPEGTPVAGLSLNETAVVETSDGRLVALMRNALDNPADDSFLWQSESTDDGRTWSAPRETRIWGYPASIRLLPDGRLLCAYGYRRPPMGIRACISNDGGRTWDVKNEMILRNDGLGHGGDMGYPMIHVFEDGEVLAVYYLTTDGKNTHIAYTRFRVPNQ